MKNLRFFVEKKAGFDLEAKRLHAQFTEELNIKSLESVRLINCYDIFDIDKTPEALEKIKSSILSEHVTDNIFEQLDLSGKNYFAVEFLDGQFDQRADSALQCVDIVFAEQQTMEIKSATVIILGGDLAHTEIDTIKSFYINPVEAQEKDLSVLAKKQPVFNTEVITYDSFTSLDDSGLHNLNSQLGLSMSDADLHFIQTHYKAENRHPTETEIKVFDTYWSDHCRHTTFETKITEVTFPDSNFGQRMQSEFAHYHELKNHVSPNKNQCLMDMATIMGKYLHKTGCLDDLEISDEDNACSVYLDVDTTDFNGKKAVEKWLLMFKNETHNHPTEIEPFGGASTCLGGAIRDPLSGRAYVYQAIRVTGSANPLEKIEDTLTGKLSQQKITTEAAQGYSSYGNQIGIATSLVSELYHQGYKAKRMEVGAVVAATPAENVVRETPSPDDDIILLGGKTGRDGCGGAAGSSKEHNDDSLLLCGAEVQKGNAPEERKIQRLFRNAHATRLIKKCNDFGAGGICVAIGELAAGVSVNLDVVPVKYDGLSGTELAISESQERMAVIVDKGDTEAFLRYAEKENLLATVVGTVTDDNRLRLIWKGNDIVNIKRDFLNTNGISQSIDISVQDISDSSPLQRSVAGASVSEQWKNNVTDLNVASQKGMAEMFDSNVGAGTILMPFGGRYQMSPIDVSISKIPVLDKDTNTVSAITWGCNPYLLEWSCYHGAMYAVIDSLAKLVASGIDYKKARLSFQEYFQKLGTDSVSWSKPFLALLGAIRVQNDFNVAAIGGKDSMSGTFNQLHVPPTFISFAVAAGKSENIISPEFKQSGSYVYLIENPLDTSGYYDAEALRANFEAILDGMRNGYIIAASPVKHGGVSESIAKMSFGNRIGVELSNNEVDYFEIKPASIVIESTKELSLDNAILLGKTHDAFSVQCENETIDLGQLQAHWLGKLDRIFPSALPTAIEIYDKSVCLSEKKAIENKEHTANHGIAKPKVLIATFPGTNSEYDMYNSFERSGAHAEILLFRNINTAYIKDSIEQIVKQLKQSQIFVLPGGFSAGDEPDGSGKFIACILQNPAVAAAIQEFLHRDGLILGICNGFQALIKSGLLPNGEIGAVSANSPTLTFNKIGRHVSQMVHTKVANNQSPWLSSYDIGKTHSIAVSHGEGRFYADADTLQTLIDNGQIATQYVDLSDNPTNEFIYNPNGSSLAIEGITSKDGKIFGKMGHSERYSQGTFKNIEGDKSQNIFLNGINYFK